MGIVSYFPLVLLLGMTSFSRYGAVHIARLSMTGTKKDKRVPCGEAFSHIYICPVGSDYSPLLVQSIVMLFQLFAMAAECMSYLLCLLTRHGTTM